MSIGLVGRKCGMSRVFTDDGRSVPVTLIEATPNRVTQVKTVETDGYNAVQVSAGAKRAALINKPLAGHYAKAKVEGGPRPVGVPRRSRRARQVRSRRRAQGRRDLRGRPEGRRRGRHQGQGLPGHDQALALHDGRRDARQLAVASLAGLDRPAPDAGSRVPGQEDGRSHGQRAPFGDESRSREDRQRASPDRDQGLRFRALRAAT